MSAYWRDSERAAKRGRSPVLRLPRNDGSPDEQRHSFFGGSVSVDGEKTSSAVRFSMECVAATAGQGVRNIVSIISTMPTALRTTAAVGIQIQVTNGI